MEIDKNKNISQRHPRILTLYQPVPYLTNKRRRSGEKMVKGRKKNPKVSFSHFNHVQFIWRLQTFFRVFFIFCFRLAKYNDRISQYLKLLVKRRVKKCSIVMPPVDPVCRNDGGKKSGR